MSCVPTPIATLFATNTETTDSLSTSTSLATETITQSAVITTITTCAVPLSGSVSACPSSTAIVSTLTPATTVTTTESLPVTLTQQITETLTVATLTDFTTPCNSGATSAPSSPAPNASSSSNPPQSVTFVNQTITNTPPLSTIFTTAPPTPDLNQSGTSGKAAVNLGPIIGGTIGGLVALIAIIGAFLCYRRRKRWDDIFEKDIAHGIGDDDDQTGQRSRMEPAPYHYGLVGHTISPSLSPPPSPRDHLLQHPSQTSHYSRTSSANASMYSRESMAPLTGSRPIEYNPANRPPSSYDRRPSFQNDIPLLSRPLVQTSMSPSSLPHDRDRRHSIGSPTRSPPTSFFITNSGPEQVNTSARPTSAGAGASSRKTRPSNSTSQPPVIVHKDGGRVNDAATTPIVPAEEPPNYTQS